MISFVLILGVDAGLKQVMTFLAFFCLMKYVLGVELEDLFSDWFKLYFLIRLIDRISIKTESIFSCPLFPQPESMMYNTKGWYLSPFIRFSKFG